MSTAAISYNSLSNAAGDARGVSRRLNAYADSLNRDVYRRLNSYSGSHTQSIQASCQYVGNKMDVLRSRAEAYDRYASDLDDLKTVCANTDRAVRGMVEKLTGEFKDAHNIPNSKVENAINYFLTSIKNSSSAGRWLGDNKDKLTQRKDYIKQSIEDWWDYEGGKQFAKGVGEALLGIAAAVAGFSLGGGILGILAVIGGTIAIFNGVVNLVNEGRAYHETHNNNDPAAGRRLSNENTIQDVMRNESEENVGMWHKIANGIDIAEIVCDVADFVKSGKELVQNAYKWTMGSMAKLDNLDIRNILTKDHIKAFGQKIQLNAKLGLMEIKSAINLKDFSNVNSILLEFGSDFMNNLKNSYTDFSSWESQAKSIGNIVKIPQTLLEGGFTAKNLLVDIGLLSIVMPNLPTLSTGPMATYLPDVGDTLTMYKFDFFNPINDTYQLFDKMENIYSAGKLSIGRIISGDDLRGKLATLSNINISVPGIFIPDITMPVINIPGMAA